MKLWKHQKQTCDRYKALSGVAYNASDPGTGKTIATLAYILDNNLRALILAPKTLLEPAWARDLQALDDTCPFAVAYASNRAKQFAKKPQVMITNIEAVNWLARNENLKYTGDYDIVVCDEATAFKNPSAQRSKNGRFIYQQFAQRINMSGTPYSKSVVDLWHQYLMLDDGARLGGSLSRFRFTFCKPEAIPGAPPGAVKWVDRKDAVEKVTELVADMTVHYSLDECQDIPPNHVEWLGYKPPKKVMDAYDQMRKDALAELENGALLQATNAAVARNKALQILSGAAYRPSLEDYDSTETELIDTTRHEIVADLVDARPASVVFFNYRHQRDGIAAQLKKRKIEYAVIDGTTPQAERGQIVADFQSGRYQTVLMHPATGAHGLTLTRAKTVIFASPLADRPDWWAQAIARVRRAGQEDRTETIVVYAEGTMERAIHEACRDGADTNQAMLEHIVRLTR